MTEKSEFDKGHDLGYSVGYQAGYDAAQPACDALDKEYHNGLMDGLKDGGSLRAFYNHFESCYYREIGLDPTRDQFRRDTMEAMLDWIRDHTEI
jgi:hypothetical protein